MMKRLKKLICITIILAMAAGIGSVPAYAAGGADAAAQAFIDVLNDASVLDFVPYMTDTKKRTVAVLDMNSDGIPELLFPSLRDGNHVDMQIWTYDGKKAVLAETPFYNALAGAAGFRAYFYRMKDGSLCYVDETGDEYIKTMSFTYYTCLESGKLWIDRQYLFRMTPHNLYTSSVNYDIELNNDPIMKGVKGKDLVSTLQSLAGFSGNVSAMVSQLYDPDNNPYPHEGMTKAEAITYLKSLISAPAGSGKWKKDSKGYWYQYPDGSYPKSKWAKIDGKWYHFDSKGYMQTGWLKDGGKWYYLASGGAMITGWKKVSGKWYYMDSSGVMQTGWKKLSGKWYYLGSDGAMVTGWKKVSGKWYYMDAGGVMQTGWKKISGKWYYLGSDGAMVTGWKKISGKWYYMNSSGVMVTGKQTIGGKTYTFDSNGVWVN